MLSVALGARCVTRRVVRIARSILGLAASFGLTRLMANMIYGVKAGDPPTFCAVALVLSAVALAATIIPARRATRIDPTITLRHE